MNNTANNSRNHFSAQTYREAMGPGYSISLMKQQPELTGQPRQAPPIPAPPLFPRHASFDLRQVGRYLLAALASTAVVASIRQNRPKATPQQQCC